jgi:hypothetical protein
MNKLDKDVLDKNFPKVTAGGNHRYDRDDILKVLTFMKDHPNVQIKTIEEYSDISLGTLVSWRKKFGQYLDIKTKQYPNQGITKTVQAIVHEVKNEEGEIGFRPISQISLSFIQELKNMHDKGLTAEVTVNEVIFKVDDQYLYVLEKTSIAV